MFGGNPNCLSFILFYLILLYDVTCRWTVAGALSYYIFYIALKK